MSYPGGCGVVFRLDKIGRQTVLHRVRGPDGSFPQAGLVRDAAGSLYGTTITGGAGGREWCGKIIP